MRKLSLLFILCSLLISVAPSYSVAQAQTADTLLVKRLLTEARQLPATTNLTLHFARKFIGVPYVAHTLEVNNKEQLVVNMRQLDCTTLVENVVALTLCVQHKKYGVSDFMNMLKQLRYRNGKIDGYASRLHYFTDWIADNSLMGFVTERQTPNPPFTAVQTINVGYMSTHPQAYDALRKDASLVPVIKAQEKKLNGKKYRFIPKSQVTNSQALRQAVNDGDIIAITCNKQGLDIAHLGFAVWRKDGLHLLNASQIHKKVVEEPMTLGQYLQKHPSHTGIRIVRINNNH